jgi:hypothetical protein
MPGLVRLARTRRAVEVVGEDVVGDVGGEEVVAGVAGFEAVTEMGSGDALVHGLEEVNAGLLVGGEVEGREVVEGRAWAADDDPFREFKEVAGLSPVGEIEEAVGADENEEGVVGKELLESGEGLDGVVGGAIGMGGIEFGDSEAGVRQAGEAEHGDSVGEGGGSVVGFERLEAHRGEEDFVQIEGVGGSGGDGEMAAVGRIEGSAEESYAHGLFSREKAVFGGLFWCEEAKHR